MAERGERQSDGKPLRGVTVPTLSDLGFTGPRALRYQLAGKRQAS